MRGLWIAAVIALLAGPARGDAIDELEVNGETLAKAGELTQAIEAFKAADAQRPRAKHACLIGLAYTRRELWPQAELFFALCRQRATPADPLPEWMDEAEHQLAAKLTATSTVAVTFAVTPADAAARISVSSFAPDETFPPRTIHLAPGTHAVQITASGFRPGKREIVLADNGPRAVTIALDLQRLPPAVPPPPPSRIPTYLIVAGVGLGAIGGLYHAFAVRPARERLTDALTVDGYTENLDAFTTRRDIVLGLYAGAAVSLAAGLILKHTMFAHEGVAVSTTVAADRVVVTLGWSR